MSRRVLVVLGVVAVLVFGVVAVVVYHGSLDKCAQRVVDDARDAGQAPPPPPTTPQAPSATGNSSKSVTHIGCDDRHSAPPTRP